SKGRISTPELGYRLRPATVYTSVLCYRYRQAAERPDLARDSVNKSVDKRRSAVYNIVDNKRGLTVETREQRGLAIAATQKLTRSGDSWLVPSQSAPRKNYVVRTNKERPYCSCPDHDALGIKCKHIFAVEFVIQRELFPDGDEQVTQTVTVTEKIKKTYKQDWPKYNAAQTNEKDKFLMLLHDLCRGIPEPVQVKGRKRIPLADAVFSACFKIYSTVSGRRFMSDMREAQVKGYVQKAPHYNSIFNYLEDPALFDVLRGLIQETSLPLKSVETKFAVDSSGFST